MFGRIYAIVARIPRGRVTTYGDVARLAGLRGGARTVGWALASVPDDRRVPWWRVIRGDGTVAPRPSAQTQRRLIRAEGVRFGRNGAVDLARYGWPSAESTGRPISRRPAAHAPSVATPHTAAQIRTATWAPSSEASAPPRRPPMGPVPKRART
jgi:methylated-DNA-protein-cysteine methyltransferase-like protein